MRQIGRVYKDSFVKDQKSYPLLILDIRTITVRKKFNISINKTKFPDGKIGSPVQGTEAQPDYHIWYNVSARGESLPSVIVGEISNAVSQSGLAYKKGKLHDPFLPRDVRFSLFSVEDDKKIDKDHIYNAMTD